MNGLGAGEEPVTCVSNIIGVRPDNLSRGIDAVGSGSNTGRRIDRGVGAVAVDEAVG
jgi:hypothetical protein